MRIGSTAAGGAVSAGAAGADPELKSIDQEISRLQKQLQDIHKNKQMDAKIKENRIKELEARIQQLQASRAQKQTETRQNQAADTETRQNGEPQKVRAPAGNAAADESDPFTLWAQGEEALPSRRSGHGRMEPGQFLYEEI